MTTDLIAELAEVVRLIGDVDGKPDMVVEKMHMLSTCGLFLRTHHATLTRIIDSEATLSANYEALVIRLGEVTTELERARKDAATELAIQRAAEVLPYGYELTIYVERDSGYADLTDPSGDVVPFDTEDCGMAEQINNAIDAAMHDSAREGSNG